MFLGQRIFRLVQKRKRRKALVVEVGYEEENNKIAWPQQIEEMILKAHEIKMSIEVFLKLCQQGEMA